MGPTRERILQAAIEVFAAKGYHGATVDEIVQASDTSKGAFYFYFRNKEQVFLSLVEDFARRLTEDMVRAIAGARGAPARVEAALRAGLSLFEQDPGLSKVFLVEAVGLNPEFEAKRHDLHRAFASLIQGYLDAAVEEGDVEPLNTEVAAFAWLGAIQEVVVHWLHTGRPASLTGLVPELAAFALRSIGYRGERAGQS